MELTIRLNDRTVFVQYEIDGNEVLISGCYDDASDKEISYNDLGFEDQELILDRCYQDYLNATEWSVECQYDINIQGE